MMDIVAVGSPEVLSFFCGFGFGCQVYHFLSCVVSGKSSNFPEPRLLQVTDMCQQK